MISTHKQVADRLIKLEIISSTLADVLTVQDGKVIVHQQFVGPRAQALAVIAWTKATGLVKQEGPACASAQKPTLSPARKLVAAL